MRARIVCVLVVAAVLGCRHRPEGALGATVVRNGQSAALVRGTAGEGNTAFVAMVDGVVEDAVPGAFTAEHPQVAVFVGNGSGPDQGTLLFLSETGERAATYPCPPFMGDVRNVEQISTPRTGSLRVIPRGGRRLLGFTTIGDYAASALIVLEATSPSSLRERAIYWNIGHMNRTAVHGRYFACAGYDNGSEFEGGRYGAALLVVDLDAILAADSPSPVRHRLSPGPVQGWDTVAPPLVLHAVLPTDDLGGEVVENLTLDDQGASVHLLGGLTWRVSFDADRPLSSQVSDSYREIYPLRRTRNPRLPESIDAHTGALARLATIRRP